MRHFSRRIRPRVRRRWLFLAAGGLSVAVALLLVARWTGSAALELVALDSSGQFRDHVALPRSWADTTASDWGAVARVPLILGVRNTGDEPVRPGSLNLSVPGHFRLADRNGRRLRARFVEGTPLIRYEVRAPFPAVQPGQRPKRLAGVDTLWLEVLMPTVYCVALSDSIPEFIPASRPAPEILSSVRIFYSFAGGELDDRQTGLLNVRLDPELLRAEASDPPPVFPAEVGPDAVPLPAMSGLRPTGVRRSRCGEPAAPVELLVTLWETLNGGRFFVLDYGGAPRKYLFDLNRDGVIELEMWDPDSDGRFEASRRAALPIPPFLMPPPPPPPFDPGVFASIPGDSMAALDRFRYAMAVPRKGDEGAPASTPRLDRLRPTTIVRGDEDEADADAPRGTTVPAAPPSRPLLGVPLEPDDRAPAPAAPAAPEEPDRPTAQPRPSEPESQPEPQPEPEPEPEPAEREIRLLGRPVAPPDTTGRRD